jgi:rfaE bifunctional protein nucleotidyltransferase chain/domain
MNELPQGLITLPSAIVAAQDLRDRGLRLVFTNGVFDLLHAGHVAYLRSARSLGDFLMVGLNSDAGTRRLKGPGRPLVSEEDRAAVLVALRPVDAVIVFDEPTASALIEALKPAVYVKGDDYALAGESRGTPLPEEPAVRAFGGEVHLIPFLPGRSTSELLARIRQSAMPG